MTDVLTLEAARCDGVVCVWRLLELGMTRRAVEHRTSGLRCLHQGVWVTGHAPVTRRQLWWGAVLSAPGRAISHASAGAAWGFRPWEGAFEVVTAAGSGGPRRFGSLMVCRSATMSDDVVRLGGLPISSPERTLADLWRQLEGERARRKMLREALRLRRVTVPGLLAHLEEAPPRNAPGSLRALAARYERLGLGRCRSDAEAYAVELIAAARLPVPEINVRLAGEEADLSWPKLGKILEVDGDQFHEDKAEDARRTRTWRHAGWEVRRTTAGLVFDEPSRFVAAARAYLRGR